MHLNVRNIIGIGLLVGSATGTWYLTLEPAEETGLSSASVSPTLGYYLQDAVLLGTDEEGELLYRVIATRVEETPDSNRLSLNGVSIRYRDQQDVPWHISASEAYGPRDRGYLQLVGDVKIERSPSPGEQTMTIIASELRIEPRKYFVSTQGPVKFLLGDTWIDAIGLRAYLKDDQIHLESDVHAQIDQ